ncbi:MAG TPA: retroviral-like aspartic protease family protein [Cellvibrio sp.]|nr:retroviral-like aspartic protease family protein [Cellvibrio sp.]
MSHTKVFLIAVFAFALGFFVSEHYAVRDIPAQWVYLPSDISLAKAESSEQQKPIAVKADQPLSPAHNQSVIGSVTAASSSAAAQFSWQAVQQLIASAKYDQAIRLLETQLGKPESAAQAWYLLAQVYKKQGQSSAALDAWFRYLNLELNAQKIDKALDEIKNYLLQLKEKPALFNEDYSWLIAQFDALLKYRINDGDLHVAMATLYLKLNDSYQAQYHALLAANDPKAQKLADDMLAQLNGQQLPEDISIPITIADNKYIVSAVVEGKPVRFLLDTGASLSGLSSNYIARNPALLKNTKPIRINTANGTQDSILFTVYNITLGNLEFTQHSLAQFNMETTSGFDGLLGVDILGRFDFVIDQDKSVLRLKSRKNK